MGLMDGKVVVVTGAGRGIGRSHALEFAAEGAKVVVNDLGVGVESGSDGSGLTRPTDERDSSVADLVVKEVIEAGGEAVADHSDLSSFAGGKTLIDTAISAFGRVDTLINNHGTLTIMKIGELDEAKVIRELAVHVIGYLGTIQAVWEPMIAQGGGTIINTSSGFGGSGPGLATYMAAKSGVFALTRDTAYEGAEHGIRCNSITPAARTRMSVPYWGADRTADWDPRWVSVLALFLASDLSAPITGRQVSLFAPGDNTREWYIGSHVTTTDGEWTPQLLAERKAEIVHQEEAPSRPAGIAPKL
jgi:NAD(P)-dependent dehydrogenase (short-subunit alcohol dehydrogenase family)